MIESYSQICINVIVAIATYKIMPYLNRLLQYICHIIRQYLSNLCTKLINKLKIVIIEEIVKQKKSKNIEDFIDPKYINKIDSIISNFENNRNNTTNVTDKDKPLFSNQSEPKYPNQYQLDSTNKEDDEDLKKFLLIPPQEHVAKLRIYKSEDDGTLDYPMQAWTEANYCYEETTKDYNAINDQIATYELRSDVSFDDPQFYGALYGADGKLRPIEGTVLPEHLQTNIKPSNLNCWKCTANTHTHRRSCRTPVA